MNDCFMIAEIGHNHQGSVETCKQLFSEAARCGCDAVKLQKRDNKSLFTKTAYNKPYDNENSYGKTYGEHREALEFNKEQYLELKDFAIGKGLIFFSTAFDIPSVDFLESIDVSMYKIASADITNTPLIEYIVKTGKSIVMSTGGASWEDVDRAYEIANKNTLYLLYCVMSYPNKPEDIDLNIIPEMIERYPLATIGFSCHYNGIVMAEGAYMKGAKAIEKHFTLSHAQKGTDHALSLEPQGLETMVHNIKRLGIAQGSGEKIVQESEKAAIEKMGKSVYPSRAIKKGETLRHEDLIIRTPGGGLEPYKLDTVIGTVSISDLSTDKPLETVGPIVI